MTCDEMEDRLNEYLDGELPGTERQEVDRHLAGCPGCRETLRGLRSIRDGAGTLPRHLEPPRDLWPGIRSALRAGKLPRRGMDRRLARWPRWAELAVAAALIVISGGVTALFLRSRPVAPETGPGGAPVLTAEATLASFRDAESEYLKATEDLRRALRERRDELSPETLAVVEENLRVIERAIREAWEALEKDPGQLRGGHVVTSLYRKQIELLQQAVRLPAES